VHARAYTQIRYAQRKSWRQLEPQNNQIFKNDDLAR